MKRSIARKAAGVAAVIVAAAATERRKAELGAGGFGALDIRIDREAAGEPGGR